jgi:hypothetical protein
MHNPITATGRSYALERPMAATPLMDIEYASLDQNQLPSGIDALVFMNI